MLHVFYESQLAGLLLIASEVIIIKGVWLAELAHGCQNASIPSKVAWQIVFFPCYVPSGNSVTFGLYSPWYVCRRGMSEVGRWL